MIRHLSPLFFILACHSTEKTEIAKDQTESELDSDYDVDWPALDAFVEERMQDGNVPGMGIALIMRETWFSLGAMGGRTLSRKPL